MPAGRTDTEVPSPIGRNRKSLCTLWAMDFYLHNIRSKVSYIYPFVTLLIWDTFDHLDDATVQCGSINLG